MKRPALEIETDRIIVQTKFGKFKEVRPISEYKVIYSTDFFAFRRGKENDISVDKHFISKKDFIPLQEKLKSMPFLD